MVQFNVYMIESPSEEDYKWDGREGPAMKEILTRLEIPHTYLQAVSKKSFFECLALSALRNVVADRSIPNVHLAVHGNELGISLTSKERFTWTDLGNELAALNSYLGNTLLLSLSSCKGAWAKLMTVRFGQLPFWGLVGSQENVTIGETALAFGAFYQNLRLGHSIEQAIKAMNAACGRQIFCFYRGDTFQQNWQNAVAAIDWDQLFNVMQPENSTSQ